MRQGLLTKEAGGGGGLMHFQRNRLMPFRTVRTELVAWLVVWLVVLGLNATLTAKVGDAYVFPGFLTPVHTQISFQNHRVLFSHASAEMRGENTLERNFASTGSPTCNHQVMSPTRSPPSHPGVRTG